MDSHYRPGPWTILIDPSTDHPPNKNKNKNFIYCLSNRSLMSAKFCALCWVNVTGLGSVSGTSYVITDHYVFAIFVAAALPEKLGSLRNLWLLSFCHFLWPLLTGSRARPSLHPSSLISRRGHQEWTVGTDEYESLSFVLFFWAIRDFRCDSRSL